MLAKASPVKPQTEQLLLDIEKAEVASGSFVTDMQFSDGEAKRTNRSRETNRFTAKWHPEKTKDSNAESNQKIENSMPEGLKKETVDLSIEASGYRELEKFISVLEQSERIIVVEAIDFTANDEIISDDQMDQLLTFQVKISAFYMPTLTDLIDQLPKLETPKPANKQNPFSYFGHYAPEQVEGNVDSITKDPPQAQENNNNTVAPIPTPDIPDVLETPDLPNVPDGNTNGQIENQTQTENIVEKDGKEYKVVSYKVQPGDTFFELAIKNYSNSKGFKLIMDWNHMQIPRRLQAGATIQIPIPVDGEI